jgi:hypothetical protein
VLSSNVALAFFGTFCAASLNQYPPKAVSEMWLQLTQNHGPLLAWAILALVVALPPALDSADIKSRRWAEFYGDRLKAALKAGRGINVAPQQL